MIVHAVEWALARAYFVAAWRELDRTRAHSLYLEGDAHEIASIAADGNALAFRSVELTAADGEAALAELEGLGSVVPDEGALSRFRAVATGGGNRFDHVQDLPAFLSFLRRAWNMLEAWDSEATARAPRSWPGIGEDWHKAESRRVAEDLDGDPYAEPFDVTGDDEPEPVSGEGYSA